MLYPYYYSKGTGLYSREEERRVTCPNCGKLVPAMVYCIYCGAKLPRITPPEKVEAPPPRTQMPTQPPRIPPLPPPSTPPPTVRISPPPTAQPAVKNEILDLISNITGFYDRKVSLLNLIKSEEISEKVFLKLYDEYTEKLNDLQNLRTRKTDELKRDLDGKMRRLEDIKAAMEELEVRHKINEVDDQRFNERMNVLKTEGNQIQTLVKDLKINLEQLEKPLAGKTPRDILNLDVKARSSYEALGKLVEEGKLTNEALNKIKPDIEKMLDFFDSIIKDRKEKEKNLREQLETLQTRYRLSEISIEEFEKRKRGVQEEIDKIWE